MKKYDAILSFSNGFYIVKLNKKYGFINTNGNEISKIIYDNVYDFENGFAKVKLNDKWGVINEHCDEIIEIKYTFNELKNKLNQYIKNHERNLKLNQLI
jgi:hypothetical protein